MEIIILYVVVCYLFAIGILFFYESDVEEYKNAKRVLILAPITIPIALGALMACIVMYMDEQTKQTNEQK